MLNPIATYRIQLHKDFAFKDLKQLVPYLVQLGIGTVYASPIMQATPGSTHGYDGINPLLINPEIGTEEELRVISQLLHQHSINWLQDIVPNHMAVHPDNKWLNDVLEKGKASPYATFFDIKWDNPPFEGKLIARDEEINYRRFFTVNELICLNIQEKKVFEAYHQYIEQLLKEGIFQGLRVDHIDGLSNPTDYLTKLRALAGNDCYIVVEKILQQHESMPLYWPVQGNTGYDFLSIVNNVFTNAGSKEAFTSFYQQLTGDNQDVQEQIAEKKAYILYHHMQGELDNLVELYFSLGLADGADDKVTLKKEIANYLIYCPVYRYYDENISLMKRDEGKSGPQFKEFYARCMQFTGPLMAKGVEDTLMYTYNRFIGHNEVGDSPENYGLSYADFHYAMKERQRRWPLSLNATSTHDTKRGEDARARLNVLTDLPEEWLANVNEWFALNSDIRNKDIPDANDEYFIYQSLIASYPMPADDEADFKDRFIAYLIKALREAKRHSKWAQPDEDYEKSCEIFVTALLNKQRPFWNSFEQLHKKVAGLGIINSLAQMVLKFTCPGVPDLYQGCELWDFSFVDPDNRRPVNYTLRQQWLNEVQNADVQTLWNDRYTGKIKLWLTNKLLQERRKYGELFNKGEYIPLQVTGKYKDHILAYARNYQQSWYVVVVPLHIAKLSKEENMQISWEDTCVLLPENIPGTWCDVLSDRSIKSQSLLFVQDIFEYFPIGLFLLTGNL